MTQNPTDEAKKRAEALAALTNFENSMIEESCDFTDLAEHMRQIYAHIDTLKSALATDTPIVEGHEFKIVAFEGEIGAKTNRMTLEVPAEYPIRLGDTAKLYAQGRTQSAVPDGWKLVPIEPTQEMIDAAEKHDEDGYNHQDIPIVHHADCERHYEAMLSAAPPVTGGAWIKVNPDNIYHGYFAWLDENSDDQEPIVCAWPPMDKYAKCFKRGYYYPLPAQPSSAEQTRGG